MRPCRFSRALVVSSENEVALSVLVLQGEADSCACLTVLLDESSVAGWTHSCVANTAELATHNETIRYKILTNSHSHKIVLAITLTTTLALLLLSYQQTCCDGSQCSGAKMPIACLREQDLRGAR